VPTELKLIVFIVEESEPINTDLICFSPTIFEFATFKFWIKNLGSRLAEPNGESKFIFSKKSIFIAEGAISVSK